ncbi:MAG: glycosyltransferase family 87 protein [Candidatus Omnitrophica bacterium]|nr:glycosyltransferase family 87 protein [Candidatus Omnitrophota bacterium]
MKINTRNVRIFIVVFLLTGMFCGLLSNYTRRAPKRNFSDFRVYHATAQRFIAQEDIYSRPDEAITPFKYSPAFAFVTAPLGFFSIKTASLIFFTLNFIAMLVIFVFSRKLITGNSLSFGKRMVLYALCGLFTSRFLLQVLHQGQVTIVMFALVVVGLWLLEKKKEVPAAALLAFSVMLKYTSAIFLPFFLFRKNRRLISLIIICIAVYCLLPAVHVGLEKEAQYLKKWLPFISDTSLDKGSLYDYKNQSLLSLCLRFFTKESPYAIVILPLTFTQGLIIAVLAASMIYGGILWRKTENRFYRALDYSLLFICMAFFNPNAWMSNFIFLIPAYMTLLYYLMKTRFKDVMAITLVVVSFALGSWGSESVVGNSLENLLEELSSVTIAGLLLTVALLRLKFSRNLPRINNDYADF